MFHRRSPTIFFFWVSLADDPLQRQFPASTFPHVSCWRCRSLSTIFIQSKRHSPLCKDIARIRCTLLKPDNHNHATFSRPRPSIFAHFAPASCLLLKRDKTCISRLHQGTHRFNRLHTPGLIVVSIQPTVPWRFPLSESPHSTTVIVTGPKLQFPACLIGR